MKSTSSYSHLKFVYLTLYRSVTSFLRGTPPPKENPVSAPEAHHHRQSLLPLLGHGAPTSKPMDVNNNLLYEVLEMDLGFRVKISPEGNGQFF